MKNKKNNFFNLAIIFLVIAISSLVNFESVLANQIFPEVNISIGGEDDGATSSLQLIVLFTVLTLSPYLLLMLTCFSRLLISLSFLRTALGTQQMPSNQILIGIALILTMFIMEPTFDAINENAIKPYGEGTISEETLLEEAMAPIREFMFKQVKAEDLQLFTALAGIESYPTPDDVPNTVLISSFILGEITRGFTIGFIMYIPFIVIDMIVASVLMAMGMMMLPPALISSPFKLIFFIMIDGWNLIISGVIRTFNQ